MWCDNSHQVGWEVSAEEGILLPLGHGLLWFCGLAVVCGQLYIVVFFGGGLVDTLLLFPFGAPYHFGTTFLILQFCFRIFLRAI